MQFLAKYLQINSTFVSWGSPPQESLGSATGLCAKKACKHNHVDKSDMLSSRLRLINQAIPCPVMNIGTISIILVVYVIQTGRINAITVLSTVFYSLKIK